MSYYTESLHTIRLLTFDEVKELKEGDKVIVCTCFDPPKKMVLEDAVVVRPMFWNSDADEPGYEVETNNGFFCPNSFFEISKMR